MLLWVERQGDVWRYSWQCHSTVPFTEADRGWNYPRLSIEWMRVCTLSPVHIQIHTHGSKWQPSTITEQINAQGPHCPSLCLALLLGQSMWWHYPARLIAPLSSFALCIPSPLPWWLIPMIQTVLFIPLGDQGLFRLVKREEVVGYLVASVRGGAVGPFSDQYSGWLR